MRSSVASMARVAERTALAVLLAGAWVLAAGPAAASVTFFTSEASWTAAVSAVAVDALDTTAQKIRQADEAAGPPPSSGTAFGPQLTFRAPSTGLCAPFVLRTLEPGSSLVFEDSDATPAFSFPDDTISIGDIDTSEDDDFRITFPTGSVFAVGLFLVDNTQDPSEGFTAFGSAGSEGRLPGTSIPDSSGNGSTFIGVVSTEPLSGVYFDEDAGGDDIAIRDFRLGCANEDPDADGLANVFEQAAGTDPNDPDTDDDGLLDGEELATGTFGAEHVISTLVDLQVSVETADVDGDGDGDVLLAFYLQDEVVWYENTDGAGSFGPQQVIATFLDGARGLSAADLDGDGDVDVVCGSYWDFKVVWYENTDGSGAFGSEQLVANVPYTSFGTLIEDVDGDGDKDPVAVTAYQLLWFENTDGAATFAPGQLIDVGLTGDFGLEAAFPADLDGDGDVDMIADTSDFFTGDRQVKWVENTDGVGTFGTRHSLPLGLGPFRNLRPGDLDGDLDADLVYGAVNWLENADGAGSFAGYHTISTSGGNASVVPADFDADGDLDLVSVASSPTRTRWFENTDGSGSFGPEIVITTIGTGGPVDVDGDGDLDLRYFASGPDRFGWLENLNVGDPLDPDSDDDGLLDGFEVSNALDPLDPDVDDDGLLDGFEWDNGFDPHVAGEEHEDPDGDGLDNLAEQAAGTNPLAADTDGDGFDDGVELAAGTDPNDPLDFPTAVVVVPSLGPWNALLLGLLVGALGWRPLSRRTRRSGDH